MKQEQEKTLRPAAQRSLMLVPSGPVISGVNGAGMLSVTGYSRARPRGTKLERALHKRLQNIVGALS